MKKFWLWVKMGLYLPAVYISAVQSRKQPFKVRFELAKAWSSMLIRMSNSKLVVENDNNIPLQDGMLFVVNHQGSLDGFVLLAASPVPISAVGKIESKKIPFMNVWYKNMDVIMFDRGSVKDSIAMVHKLTERLNLGHNMVIFPEGTRSYGNTMGEFKAGSLKAAIVAKVPIVPVALIDSYKALDDPKAKKVIIKVRYLQPIHHEEYQSLTIQQLADEVRSRIQQQLERG
ncbi:MAG: 1-acyl-sn-glycerol-3-phosphate acyltransferase [Firmicutes bacterium HGW-Firmicutes-19]|jgi:1-acyl-sn-glycerol-3-phosphate acyltransferase|nr:MAG: 1-acyl-sn-glycerol-3-phosphate acyltransferase [Firmicutes bacterium HGW-Firmicutes-19]